MWGQGSSEAGQVWPSDSEPGHFPPPQARCPGRAVHASLCPTLWLESPPRAGPAGSQHGHRKYLQTSSKSVITVSAADLRAPACLRPVHQQSLPCLSLGRLLCLQSHHRLCPWKPRPPCTAKCCQPGPVGAGDMPISRSASPTDTSVLGEWCDSKWREYRWNNPIGQGVLGARPIRSQGMPHLGETCPRGRLFQV